MNILLVAHSGSMGTTSKRLVALAHELQCMGTVHATGPHPHRGLWKAMEEAGARFHYIEKIHELAQDKKFDLIISNTIAQANGAEIANEFGIPHIWWVHEILSKDPELQVSIDEQSCYELLRKSGKIVSVSRFVKKEMERIGCNNVSVIYDYMNCGAVPIDRGPIKKILNISNISIRKDIVTFLKALAQAGRTHPDIQAEITGNIANRAYFDRVRRFRKTLGLEQNCKFCGYKEDKPPVERDVQLLVHTARCEPFGMGILEAQAAGLPVIATRSGGPEEIILDGESGLLCDVGDYNKIAECIVYLMENQGIAQDMGMAGYERVKREYTYEEHMAAWKTVILETMNADKIS